MKFKVLKGTDLFKKLMVLKKHIDAANEKAHNVAVELGGTGVATTGNYLAGEIGGIYFETGPDLSAWRYVGQKYQNIFLPKAKNKKAWDKILTVEKLKNEELNVLLGLGTGLMIGGALEIFRRPGVEWGENQILISLPEWMGDYKPVADMVEIKVSEFNKLQKEEAL